MRLSNFKSLMALLFAFALVAAACSGDDDPVETGSDDGTTETTEAMEESDDDATETTEAMEESDDDAMADLAGTTVTIAGPENSERDIAAIEGALDVFAKANDVTIVYSGTRSFSDDIGVRCA